MDMPRKCTKLFLHQGKIKTIGRKPQLSSLSWSDSSLNNYLRDCSCHSRQWRRLHWTHIQGEKSSKLIWVYSVTFLCPAASRDYWPSEWKHFDSVLSSNLHQTRARVLIDHIPCSWKNTANHERIIVKFQGCGRLVSKQYISYYGLFQFIFFFVNG